MFVILSWVSYRKTWPLILKNLLVCVLVRSTEMFVPMLWHLDLWLVGWHRLGIWVSSYKSLLSVPLVKTKPGFIRLLITFWGNRTQRIRRGPVLVNKIEVFASFVMALKNSNPMNSADRQSLQFTINKILLKIFGAMSKRHIQKSVSSLFWHRTTRRGDWCSEGQIVEEYCATDNYICRLINARH